MIIFFSLWVVWFIAVLAYENTHDSLGVWFEVFISFFYSFFLAVLFSIILWTVLPSFLETRTYETATPIVALQDNVGTQGSFFLGSGTVESEMKYFYLTKDENGVRLHSLDASAVAINETDQPPHISRTYVEIKNDFWRSQLPLATDEGIIKVYIPKNSIKYNFNVDLKN